MFLEWCFGNPVIPGSLRNGVSPDNLHGLAAVASGGRYECGTTKNVHGCYWLSPIVNYWD